MTSVHIRINHEESVYLKKELLSSEVNTLKIIKLVKSYQILRTKEIKLKQIFNKDMNDTLENIRRIEKDLPKTESTHIKIKEDIELEKIKKDSKSKKQEKIKLSKEQKESNELESQLREIQERLQSLG